MRDVSSVTALKGKSVSLVCPLYVAAWASVSWEKGSNKIPFNHRQRVQPDGSLSISNVQQVSDDGNYVCRFTDSRNQKHTGNVLLKVIEPPVISHYEFRKDMQVGMRIKVFCTVVQGDPPFLFTWLKDGVPVVENGAPSSQAAINVHNERDYSMLSTDSLQLEHSGNYTCVVKNQAATTAYSAVLRVNEPPKWDVEPESAAVVQGRNVQLQCSASGTPQPIITWMIASDSTREEFLPLYNSHKYGLFPNGTLSIHQLEPEESGYYLCKASNGFGEDLSKLVFLTVKRPPKFDVKFRAHAVKRGEKARLQCTAVGDLPIAMTWSKNNDRVPEKSKYKVTTVANQSLSSVSSILVVSTETVEDSGIYSCFAKNHYGSDETSMRLLVQEVPGPPVNVTVANATGNSLFLTWGEPFRGNSAITRYLVQFREAGSDDDAALRNITTNSSLTSATIGPLRPARVFSLRVKAENGIGWGRFSNWVTANTEEHSPASPPLNITARPTGPNSIKISWEPPKEEDWNGHLKGYYITYRPAGSNEQHYHKTVEVHNPHQRQEIHLTNLRLSMSYSVAIQAFTGKGTGPMSREVLVKTLDDVPPSPPTLEVVSVSTSSVTLGWSLKTSFGNPVTEYVLHQRKEADHWQETPISTMQPVYTVRDLECGTTYQFYMTAHNSLGRSEPSDVIRAKTDGAAPLSPSKEEFIQASQRHASLSLRSWKSGGCELLDFTVKLRQGAAQAWATVAEGLPANQTQLLLRNLTPGATYHVHVVARSTAGATEAQYEFTTPNGTAHVASVEATSSQPKRSSLPSMTDLEILVPILVSSCVVLIVIVVGCILCSRESLCADRHCGRPDLRAAYSEEVVDMKDLANTAECMARCEDGMHHSASQMNSRFPPAGQSIYAQRPVVETEDDRHPYAMPYDVLHSGGGGGAAEGAAAEDGGGADGAGCQNHLDGRNTLKRRSDLKDHRSNNIYISRQVWLVCLALVQHVHGGQQRQPSPFEMSSGVNKNQLDLAKELLRLFNLHHVLASMNVSHSVRLGSGNEGSSFVPSNPYWILMNHTQRRQPVRPSYVPTAVNKTSAVKPTGHLVKVISTTSKRNHTQSKTSRYSTITALVPEKSPSSGYSLNSTGSKAVQTKNHSFVAPLPMEKFTFEDAPKSRPLLRTLHKESLTEKIERAKTSSFSTGRMRRGPKTKIRSTEIDGEAAASDFKLQPAMRIITSPGSSVKHEIPVAFNHAFIVLGQPVERKKALASDYEVSVLGAVLGDLIDQSESAHKHNRTRQYKHVFNIGDKPVIQITEVSNTNSEQTPKTSSSAAGEDVSSRSAVYKHWSSSRTPVYKKGPVTSVRAVAHSSPTAPRDNEEDRFEQPSNTLISPRTGEPTPGTSASELQNTYKATRPFPSTPLSYHTSRHESFAARMFTARNEQGAPLSGGQWAPFKKTLVKRDVSSKTETKTDAKTQNASAPLSALLDDTNTIKPGKKWRGILKPRYYETVNFTVPQLLPGVIFTPDIRGTPISSISPFDEAPIGSVHRVVTIYGKKTNHKPLSPVAVVVAEGSQPSSTVMQQTSIVKRRHDEPDTPKPKYLHSLSDKYGERPPPPDRKDDYLLHKGPKGFRGEGRRPPLGGGRHPPPLEPKFDPEFERSRFLKPPPLFPERDRPPHHGRHPDDHPRHRDGPPYGGYGHRHPDKGHYTNGEHPDRPGKRLPPYHDVPDRSEGLPPREDGEYEEDLDPSRFDDYEAWRHLTRPPLPAGGFPPPFMPGYGAYPPFRGPPFQGGGPPFQGGGPPFQGGGPPFLGGPGIGTILPGKKMEKFKYLLKGGFRGAGGLRPSFFGAPQGWYCPCNYYPPAGRFVTQGYPGFWGPMRGD
ncbi:uncharacterized protein [Dermacentor albipictus]